ncbi:MAG: 23S rRNA (uracil(1939)-C(5))-methyltransferase RlmD [Candidatus Omnitrophota bacterium]
MKICKHFSECGGCRFQDIPYKQQLATKEAKVRDLATFHKIDTELKPINSFPPEYYRNKMEFSFADQEGVVCGLYSKREKRKVVDIEECLIFSPDLGALIKAIKDFVKKKKHSVYDKYSHQGFLRYLIIRETKFTQEMMIGIVTSSSEALDVKGFIKVLTSLKLKSTIKSIYQIVSDSFSDAVVFDKKELLYGQAFIEERLDELTFRIGIDTFFQVNPYAIVDFYKKIRDYARASSAEQVLDLFCGVGSIGMFLARDAKFVWGVEREEEIVDLAWQNAKLNRIDNISFFTADSRKFLNTQGAFYKNTDFLVVNPPRCGLSPKIIRAILRLEPKNIIYSSCNPEAFFGDLEGFLGQYSLDFIEPFDFFPHTPHLECLSFLKRNN